MMEVRDEEGVEQRDDAKERVARPENVFNIDDLVQRLKQESDWRNDGRNQITMVHSGPLRVSLHIFQAGKGIPGHRVSGPFTFLVRKGHVRIQAEGMESVELREGEIFYLEPCVPHSVLATEESVCLLSYAQTEGPADGNDR